MFRTSGGGGTEGTPTTRLNTALFIGVRHIGKVERCGDLIAGEAFASRWRRSDVTWIGYSCIRCGTADFVEAFSLFDAAGCRVTLRVSLRSSDQSATSQGDHRFLPSTSFHFDKRQKKIQKTDGRLLVHRNLRYGGFSNHAHVTSVATQALVVNPSKRFFKTDS